MKMIKTTIIALSLLMLLNSARSAEQGVPQEAIKNWQDARFGMFIHWGPVSLTGHEIGWSRGRQTPVEEYDNLYKKFNPVNPSFLNGHLKRTNIDCFRLFSHAQHL